jgi:hypothetical protein
MAIEREGVLLEKVEDRHFALMVRIGRHAADRFFVEGHLDEPRLLGGQLLLLFGQFTSPRD